MQVRFGNKLENITQNYTGVSDPASHVEQYKTLWSSIPETEWTHRFIHTLDTIMKNWYLDLEMCRETTRWDELVQRFEVTFTFEYESPLMDATLQAIRTKIFSEKGPMEVVLVCNAHRSSITIHDLFELCNVAK
jgi:hypothetical protein